MKKYILLTPIGAKGKHARGHRYDAPYRGIVFYDNYKEVVEVAERMEKQHNRAYSIFQVEV